MLRRKYSYTIYDDNDKVIIISRNKRIAKQFAKENKMPKGKGTYGSKVGRPPKKPKGGKKK